MEHTIIYTGSTIPPEHSRQAIDGTMVYERLVKRPIRVESERADAEGQLDPRARLNYSKIYTVEHYVRILNIGIVHPNSLATLREDSPYRRDRPTAKQANPPAKPTTNPPVKPKG